MAITDRVLWSCSAGSDNAVVAQLYPLEFARRCILHRRPGRGRTIPLLSPPSQTIRQPGKAALVHRRASRELRLAAFRADSGLAVPLSRFVWTGSQHGPACIEAAQSLDTIDPTAMLASSSGERRRDGHGSERRPAKKKKKKSAAHSRP